MKSFAQFKLLPTLQESLIQQNFKTPTQIQIRTIPLLLAGHSVVGISETGSGKTMAYSLPILHLLKNLENVGNPISEDSRPRAAIIVPTRELGEQVARVIKSFTHVSRLRVRTILGGTKIEAVKRNISGQFEILIATPGRLVQLLDRGLIFLQDVQVLVFDEVDQMLDPGFLSDAKRIVNECRPDRQMAMFSATISPEAQALLTQLFDKAEVIRSEGSHRVVPTLVTQNRSVLNGKRFPLLEELLEKPVTGGTLIFTNTRKQCDILADLLLKSGKKCLIYRGEMNKGERRDNLKKFRNGQIELLIATDLAARGLDIEHVGRVINYHLPHDIENYMHRVGRTARAGKKGLVINLVTERDENLIKRLEKIRSK